MSTIQNLFPKSICLRLTRRCNAACSFCQAPNTSRAELAIGAIERLCAVLEACGVQSLKLSGGEPTIRPDLPSILEMANGYGLRPVVITNGISMPQELISVASATGTEFKFSVHRPDFANDAVLRVRSFNAIVANMAACRRHGVPFAINTVVTAETIDLMEPMVIFASGRGARKISFIPVVPRGRAAKTRTGGITPHGVEIVHERVAELANSYRECVIVRCIDIRRKDYWVIENDGTLWIERQRDALDVRVCGLDELLDLHLARGQVLRGAHY